MKEAVVIISGVVALLANIPYFLDVRRGKSKPNIATWSTWILVNAIAAAAAYSAGAMNAVILSVANLIGLAAILAVGIRRGTRKYTTFDFICQGIAITGIILWQLSNNPNIALTFALVADLCAITPTFRHAYSHPNEETWSTYLIAGLAALTIALAAKSYTYAALIIPLNIFITNTLLVATIIVRKRKRDT